MYDYLSLLLLVWVLCVSQLKVLSRKGQKEMHRQIKGLDAAYALFISCLKL